MGEKYCRTTSISDCPERRVAPVSGAIAIGRTPCTTVLLVPEFDWWVPGMRQWLEQARERFAPDGSLDALWVTERRTRLSAGYLDRRFAELRDEAGLSKDLTLHSLRHSYVTHLLEFGYADRFVQEQVGHMHASTTSIYASVSSDYKNRVLAEALKALIEGEADDR